MKTLVLGIQNRGPFVFIWGIFSDSIKAHFQSIRVIKQLDLFAFVFLVDSATLLKLFLEYA